MRTADADDILTLSRRSNGAHFIVDEKTGSDNGTVAEPSPHLKAHTAGRTTATQVAGGIHGNHADGIMVPLPIRQMVWGGDRQIPARRRCRAMIALTVLDIDDGLILRFLQPLLITLFRVF